VTDSLAQHLQCIDCGAVHPLGYRLECDKCQGLLELRYDLAVLRGRGPGALTGHGLWRYAPVLPIVDPAHRVTLGEGATPLGNHPQTPWGVPTIGYRTRKKGKQSDRYIVRGRRRGKKGSSR